MYCALSLRNLKLNATSDTNCYLLEKCNNLYGRYVLYRRIVVGEITL